jgi:hypothetical protein
MWPYYFRCDAGERNVGVDDQYGRCCRQRVANVGGSDLVFLAICTPRFMPAAYEDLDT